MRTDTKKQLVASYSMVKGVLQCQQKAYYASIMELERKKWVKHYLEGNLFQFGIYQLMIKKPVATAIKEMEKLLETTVKQYRKDLSISSQDEKVFVEVKAIMNGMLVGYAKNYERDLRQEKHIANEASIVYPFNAGKFGCQMDNIIEIKNKWYLHEGKAWKYINPDNINNIKNSLQIAIYFHMHNEFYKKITVNGVKAKPFEGIIYDIAQKPSIRQKMGETYRGFLKRLGEYYTGPDRSSLFYKEVIDEPAIKKDDLFRTLTSAIKTLNKLKEGKTPLKTYNDCGYCDYYELCFDGETKRNLSLFRKSTYSDRYKKEESK